MWIITERLLALLLVITIIFQVIIPIILDKPMFWWFRKKEKFLGKDAPVTFDETIEHLKEERIKTAKAESELNAEIESKVDKINELRKPSEDKV